MALQPLSGLKAVTPAAPGTYEVDWADPYVDFAPGGTGEPWTEPWPQPWVFNLDYPWSQPDAPPEGVGTLPGPLPPGADPDLYAAPTETGSHAGPWPVTSPEDSVLSDTGHQVERARELEAIRSAGTGRAGTYGLNPLANNDWWNRTDPDYTTPGSTLLVPVPDQIRGSVGLDHVQGFMPDAPYGFGDQQVHDPAATGSVPGNTMWLVPAPLPDVLAPDPDGKPVGPDSPFYGQEYGLYGAGDVNQAYITTEPPAYVPPADPPTGPALAASDATWSSW